MTLASDIGDRFKVEFAGKIVSVISAGLLTVLLARLLNPDSYGLLFLAISILGLVKLFTKLGISKSASRYITEYKENDPGQLQHIIRFSFLLNLGTITIVCLILFFSREFIAIQIGEPDLTLLLTLGVFFVAFGTIVEFVRSAFQGFEAIKPAAALHATDRGIRLVLAIGFVILGYGAVGAFVGYILAYLIAAVIGLWYLYHRFYWNFTPSVLEDGLRRRIAEYTVPLTATNAAGVLDRADTVLVGFFIGPIAVAYYTIGKQVVDFIETPVKALGFTLSPTYGAQAAKGNYDIASKLYETALINGLLLYIPAAAGLVLISEPMVELVFGADYLGAVIIIQVMSIYAILKSIIAITSRGLDYLGHARKRAIVKGITAILNIFLNIILIPWIGVVGAAIATVITYSIYTFVNLFIMYNVLGFQLKSVAQKLALIVLITVIMSISIYPLVSLINKFITLFAVIATGIFIWGILATITGFLDIDEIKSVLM